MLYQLSYRGITFKRTAILLLEGLIIKIAALGSMGVFGLCFQPFS
jgi:hypothetical protein